VGRWSFRLTEPEHEVACAVTTGASHTDIAFLLGETERTVKMHFGSVFKKRCVRDRVHLVLCLTQPCYTQPSGS